MMTLPTSFSEDTFLLVGYLKGAHGVHGSVHAHLDDPALAHYLVGKPLTLRPSRRIQRPVTEGVHCRHVTSVHHADTTHFLISLEGVSDRTQADNLKGFELWMSRNDYPSELSTPDSVRLADLIGFKICVTGGVGGDAIGVVKGFFESGDQTQVFLEIYPLDTSGKPQLIPFNQAMVPHIDMAQQVVEIPLHIAEWLQSEWQGDLPTEEDR